MDNTSVNIGTRNSLKTRIVEKNPAIFFNGCPCHIIHNAARKASEAFCESCGFDIEEFTIDLYYWFDKSTKRKIELQSYCSFCDQAYRAIIKHVSTRWLSLELAIERALNSAPGQKFPKFYALLTSAPFMLQIRGLYHCTALQKSFPVILFLFHLSENLSSLPLADNFGTLTRAVTSRCKIFSSVNLLRMRIPKIFPGTNDRAKERDLC